MFSEYLYVYFVSYCIISLIVAMEAGSRGWKTATTFFVCILATPLIGAILYGHYKKEFEVENNSEIQQNTEDPALTDLIEHLESKRQP